MLAELIFGSMLWGAGSLAERSERKARQAQAREMNKWREIGYRAPAQRAIGKWAKKILTSNIPMEQMGWMLYAMPFWIDKQIIPYFKKEEVTARLAAMTGMTPEEFQVWFINWTKREHFPREKKNICRENGKYYCVVSTPIPLHKRKDEKYHTAGQFAREEDGLLVPILPTKKEEEEYLNDRLSGDYRIKGINYYISQGYKKVDLGDVDLKTFLENAPDATTVFARMTGHDDWYVRSYD